MNIYMNLSLKKGTVTVSYGWLYVSGKLNINQTFTPL